MSFRSQLVWLLALSFCFFGSAQAQYNISGGGGGSDSATASTALGALNATISVSLAGQRGATFQLQSGGTGVYTVTPQCSFDGGTIYNSNGYIQDPFSGAVSTTATVASGQGTTTYPVMCPQGASHAQMKVTAYTSGTANWLARATVATWPSIGWGAVTTSAPTYTTGQISPFSLATDSGLRIHVVGSDITNQTVNMAQLNSVALGSPSAYGTSPGAVNVIGANAFITNSPTVQPGNTANTTPWLTTDSATSATGSAVPSKAAYIGGNGSGNLTGVTVCDHWTPVSITASTQVITGAASKQTYICSINLVVSSADNVALVEGTGTTCGTGTAGMAGGTTAATGWNFAANGGLTQGAGFGVVAATATAADNVCLLVSGTAQVSGAIGWTQH